MIVPYKRIMWFAAVRTIILAVLVLIPGHERAAAFPDQTVFPLEKMPDEFIYDDSEVSKRRGKTIIRKSDPAYEILRKFFASERQGWDYVDPRATPTVGIWFHSYKMDIYCHVYRDGSIGSALVTYVIPKSDPEYFAVPEKFSAHVLDTRKAEEEHLGETAKFVSDVFYAMGLDTWAYDISGESDPRWNDSFWNGTGAKAVMIEKVGILCPDVFSHKG
jgi:hypothetical protein